MVVAAVGAVALGVLTDGVAAASLTYSVTMRWGATAPECVAPVVCSGTGTGSFSYGTPFESSAPATLDVGTKASVSQVDDQWAIAGSLRYCNGTTIVGTTVDAVDLDVAVNVTGVGSASTSDTTLLLNTVNSEDPLASADVLSFSSDPARRLHVLEGECAEVELRTRLTIVPNLGIEVSLGEILTPGSGFVTVDGRREVAIEIKPGGVPNPIKLTAQGVVPVAILGSALTDVRTIDPGTVRFEGGVPDKQKVTDVNKDGILDLLIHVPYQSLVELHHGDTQACATFATLQGELLIGCDTVKVL